MQKQFINTCLLTVILCIGGCTTGKQVPVHESPVLAEREQIATEIDTGGVYTPRQKEDLPPLKPTSPSFYAPPPELEAAFYRVPALKLPDNKKPAEKQKTEQIRTEQGYRIQVIAIREQDAAMRIERAMREMYGESVYLIYEAPTYKVRVGDFLNRDEANRFCEQLNASGYRDAWVVRSVVTVRE